MLTRIINAYKTQGEVKISCTVEKAYISTPIPQPGQNRQGCLIARN